MNFLYLTADEIGIESGGGLVTSQESQALQSMGNCEVWDRSKLDAPTGWNEPWRWDEFACSLLEGRNWENYRPQLCHIYSGTWGKTVKVLKDRGCKTVITVAAHDKEISRREHEKLGIQFGYTHLTDPQLWQRYIRGYQLADCIVCPGKVPAKIVRDYPCMNRIEIISHGCTIPNEIKPLSKSFVLGYLGSFGCDKGVRYLLEAWAKLNYRDATLLLAGRDSNSQFGMEMIRVFGGGNIRVMGWVKDVGDFYNQISCYVQPSQTEGFGLEVVEALAYGRPVICSDGAGVADLVSESFRVNACDVYALAASIDDMRKSDLASIGRMNAEIAKQYSWDKIREKYVGLWLEVLGEKVIRNVQSSGMPRISG